MRADDQPAFVRNNNFGAVDLSQTSVNNSGRETNDVWSEPAASNMRHLPNCAAGDSGHRFVDPVSELGAAAVVNPVSADQEELLLPVLDCCSPQFRQQPKHGDRRQVVEAIDFEAAET